MIPRIWLPILGILSSVCVLYFWITLIAPVGWLRPRPGDFGILLLGMIVSVVLSVIVATKASRLWYIVTLANVATLIWIMLRIH